MIVHISKPYLWLPVDKSAPVVKLHFYVDGEKVQEIDIALGGVRKDFDACVDVRAYVGCDIEIQADVSEEALEGITCHGEKVQTVYPYRPKLHFSPEMGWHNDPNGLVFADGVYHLYYQWNPYGVVWGNMHWGHAVSKDLLTWEHKPMVLAPDAYGTVYSGCGWQDKENAAGFGENALLFHYTAAGGSNQWSKDAGNLHTQRLAVSVDSGETLQRVQGAILEHIKGENRDPKVFYHAKSKAYIMALYLDGNEFAIFRSEDLLHWEESQRLVLEGMWECPDLLELPVENVPGEKKWIFWSADGYYVVGDFDGYTFVPQSWVQSAYVNKLPYAAQTYAGVQDRVISVAWLRLENDRGNYRGVMALPAELGLRKLGEEYHVCLQPVRELQNVRSFGGKQELVEDAASLEIAFAGEPLEVDLAWEADACWKAATGQEMDETRRAELSRETLGTCNTGLTRLLVGETKLVVDLAERKLILGTGQEIAFPGEAGFKLKLLIDQEVIEFYGNDGILYGAIEVEENLLGKSLQIENFTKQCQVEWYRLKVEK